MNETAIAFVCFLMTATSAIISFYCISHWDWDLMLIAMACAVTSGVLIAYVLLYRFVVR